MNWENLKNRLIKSNYYYWHTKNGVLLHGDCIEVIKKFPSNSIDIVFTSPPYNIGIQYDEWNDCLPYNEYLQWCKKWISALYKTAKNDGRVIINHYLSCGSAKFRFAPLMNINCIAEKRGFKHYGIAIWWDITLSKRTAWGSWLSARAPYLNSPFEGILVLYKNIWRKERKGTSDIDKDMFMQAASGIWKIQPERIRNHPAPFPKKLVEYVLKFFSFKDDIVLDPFIGSGTTAIVAEKLGRKWIGIDISKTYCKEAKQRITAEIGQLKLWK